MASLGGDEGTEGLVAMQELKVIGVENGALLAASDDGARFRIEIDEVLQSRIRQAQPETHTGPKPSPREVQSLIRSGLSAEDVAQVTGASVDYVRRFEGPVLAEREHVAELARGTRVGRDVGAPTLGDLVTDRLAARGVDPASLAWDAARDASGPWMVLARFAVADAEHEARWTFDLAKRTVVADEDEARWLSETELPDEPVSRRHLAAVRDVVFDFQGDGILPVPQVVQQ